MTLPDREIRTLELIPLRGRVILPGSGEILPIGSPWALAALERAKRRTGLLACFIARAEDDERPRDAAGFYPIGVAAMVVDDKSLREHDIYEPRVVLLSISLRRVRLLKVHTDQPHGRDDLALPVQTYEAVIETVDDVAPDAEEPLLPRFELVRRRCEAIAESLAIKVHDDDAAPLGTRLDLLAQGLKSYPDALAVLQELNVERRLARMERASCRRLAVLRLARMHTSEADDVASPPEADGSVESIVPLRGAKHSAAARALSDFIDDNLSSAERAEFIELSSQVDSAEHLAEHLATRIPDFSTRARGSVERATRRVLMDRSERRLTHSTGEPRERLAALRPAMSAAPRVSTAGCAFLMLALALAAGAACLVGRTLRDAAFAAAFAWCAMISYGAAVFVARVTRKAVHAPLAWLTRRDDVATALAVTPFYAYVAYSLARAVDARHSLAVADVSWGATFWVLKPFEAFRSWLQPHLGGGVLAAMRGLILVVFWSVGMLNYAWRHRQTVGFFQRGGRDPLLQ